LNNFIEEKKPLTLRLAMEEASRCLLCKDAPCTSACPAGTDPGRFIRALRFKNLCGAVEVIRENNALASICARVCPTEKYCQNGCTRCGIDKPIDIGAIQRFLCDFETDTKMNVLEFKEYNGKRVAIIGSGPAGLTSALELRKMGYSVTIFEKDKKPGGYLRYGIPSYRLPIEVLDKEIKRITDSGVEIKINECVSKERLEAIKQEYDAVILAIGYSKGKMIPIFEGNKKAILAVDFLHKVKEKNNLNLPDNVLVIGGGDVAMDVCVTLKKLGVSNVTDIVYEGFSEFRASKEELALARKENVSIIDGYVPKEYKRGGYVTFSSRFIDSEIKIKADLIILATGQTIDNIFDLDFNGNCVENSKNRIDNTNLFVAGDISTSEKTVVYSVKSGKEVARSVDEYLGGNK
jgi:dihydropyrimidine dehydrogenase (NAD+) subunit PreT